jgi:hypothetical protein
MKIQNKVFHTIALLAVTGVFAQKPTEVPKPSDKPIDLSNPADIIIYIILPLVAVMFFFIWKRKRKIRK